MESILQDIGELCPADLILFSSFPGNVKTICLCIRRGAQE
jgi:hypothetical protein